MPIGGLLRNRRPLPENTGLAEEQAGAEAGQPEVNDPGAPQQPDPLAQENQPPAAGAAGGVEPPTFMGGVTQKFSWNLFRYAGDLIHLVGVLIMLLTMVKNKSVAGFSLRTAMIYAILFTSRYLDLVTHRQPMYLVFFKVFYILTSYIAFYLFVRWFPTFERNKDTVNVALILALCFVAAVFTTNDDSFVQVFWVYSQYLEAFALVPQYVFCYRDPGNRDAGVVLFIMCIGIYRCFYAANWIYKKAHVASYNDIHSWIGGALEILFFIDYLLHHFGGVSILKTMVLGVDNGMRYVSDSIEYKLVGTSSESRDEARAEGMRQRLPRTTDEARELDMEMELAL
eukprot:gene1225-745_t